MNSDDAKSHDREFRVRYGLDGAEEFTFEVWVLASNPHEAMSKVKDRILTLGVDGNRLTDADVWECRADEPRSKDEIRDKLKKHGAIRKTLWTAHQDESKVCARLVFEGDKVDLSEWEMALLLLMRGRSTVRTWLGKK